MQQPRQMYQDGSIMPRLNELGTEVSSAEQMLQQINQRLQSAESTLGEGGATQQPASLASDVFTSAGVTGGPQVSDLSQPLFDKDGFRLGDQRYGTGLVSGPSMALPENPMSGGPMQSPLASAMRNMAANGGMMNRQQYGLGSIVKSVTKGVKSAVKGVAKTVKKNPMLALAAFNFAPMLVKGGASTFLGGKNAMFGLPTLFGGGTKFLPGTTAAMKGAAVTEPGLFGMAKNFFTGGSDLANTAKIFAGGSLLGGLLNQAEEEGDPEGITRDVGALRSKLINAYKNQRTFSDAADEDAAIAQQVEIDLSEYNQDMNRANVAYGGRIGYAGGTEFEEYLKGREEFNKKQNAEQLYKEFLENKRREKVAEQKTMAANGGRIGFARGPDNPEQNAIQAAGIMNLPLNQNPAGVTELDLRETGGFIPPVGVKEKADDIPAMLANNEFVFTADAVRGMGDGNVNKGAQRMYDMMKKLEKGGRV